MRVVGWAGTVPLEGLEARQIGSKTGVRRGWDGGEGRLEG